MNQNYTYIFLLGSEKIYFFLCRRILVISLCVPLHEKLKIAVLYYCVTQRLNLSKGTNFQL